MGVDLAVYRSRIGRFVPRPVRDIVSNVDYLCKAIASVRGGLIRQDGLKSKGAVTFISLLLRAQGIEPNPGPRSGKESEHSFSDTSTADNGDINITIDSNADPDMAERISQAMESVLPVINPTDTGSSQSNEDAGAVAIPGPSSGAIAKPTILHQVVINYHDKRKYNEEFRVENIKVKNAENVCTGDLTINHAAPTDSDDDSVPKRKKKREEEKGVPKCHKRNACEETGVEDESISKPKKMKQEKEAKSKSHKQIMLEGQAGDDNDKDIPKQRKKSDKRILLEENTEVMLERHIQETENLLVTRTGAEAAVVERLKDYNMVIIAGVTGEGKTTLGREICKQLRDGTLDKDIKPKTPVLMTIPQDWNDVVNDKDDIVVFVDDIFGKTNYQTGLLNGWKPFFDRMLQCLQEKHVCLVVTSRTHILKDARRESGVLIEMISDHILSEKKTVDLTDDQKLTSTERFDIYKNYSRQRRVDQDVLSTVPVYGFPPNISLGFAQVCKLFFTNDNFFEKGEQFFMKPDRILTEEIERMKSIEPHKYLALVYCFLKDESVDIKKLNRLRMSKEDYETLKLYAETCDVLHTDNILTLLKNGLDALDRTYLTKQNTVFTFGHQSIADSVSIVFGKENPEMVIEKCSKRVILELLDISEKDQTDMCTLHVPNDCFEHLVKRIYKMIIKGLDGITLESFPKFTNQEFADCLFEYVITKGDIGAFHRAHLSGSLSFVRSLLESCANNAFFLKAFFEFKVDEFIVRESGILFFTRTLQRTLRRSLEHKNKESMSILLANGAFFTEQCLREAITSNDVGLIEFVLSKNVWIRSEIQRYVKPDTPEHLRDVLERGTSFCRFQEIMNRYRNQKLYEASTQRSHVSAKDMTRVVKEMDFNALHTILQSQGLQKQHSRLMKGMLENKCKQLDDAIAIKRIARQIDKTIVQYALHYCDLDMFRFLLFSSNISASQMDSLVSEAIHLHKIEQTDVLINAGGQPTLEDFINKAGTVGMGVEQIIETIMITTSWTRAQLDRVLDATVRSGTQATMEVLIKGGAHFSENALVNVSKRHYGPVVEYRYELPPSSTKVYDKLREHLSIGDQKISVVQNIHEEVKYVFLEHKWSQKQLDDALDAALVSGSELTIQLLRYNGGMFHSDALLAAVRKLRNSLLIVKFVQDFGEWSVDQLSYALHEAIVICRPEVITYLNEQGAMFNDSSLTNVLRWKVEQHVHTKIIKQILKARTWSPFLLGEAITFACETEGGAILASVPIAEARSESLSRNVLLKLRKVDKNKKWTIQTLKSRGMDADLGLVLNEEILEGCVYIVEHLICELKISCDNDGLSNAMDNTRNYQNYDRLKMVRLVRESQDWSDELLTKALDKAVRHGYSDVILYLHSHGAKFSDNSLEYAMMHKNTEYDPYELVTYIMESYHYNNGQMHNALKRSLEIGHYRLMKMFHEKGAEFEDKSLQNAIHKEWIHSDRLPAVQFILNARQWDTDQKNDALCKAVKLGDVRVVACLLKCGGEVSKQCLTEILEKKCKPSHRLCIVRLLLSNSGSLSRELLEETLAISSQLSEPKLEEYIRQCIK